ncbi:high-potential iron-sulfur protein [Chenggangzhangella methanolivorans]|uniref:High-potential iron-sulfur protein n=2 Tax=Chenggangzhangella methanolivorans TaxID=1437009 RepID=A0A9E6UQE4_9HYPH|nr:high-potential iron-sulfur protein [Chenggangzhangella methanolivorans]
MALGGAAAIAVGAACAATGPARAQTKQSQADVQYVAKAPAGDKCSGCAMFQPPEGCQGVEGKISPEGWCSLYTPKA